MTLFPNLKDVKQWDKWKLDTLAQTKAPNVSKVFQSHCMPTNVALFKAKQKYNYSLFVKTIKMYLRILLIMPRTKMLNASLN